VMGFWLRRHCHSHWLVLVGLILNMDLTATRDRLLLTAIAQLLAMKFQHKRKSVVVTQYNDSTESVALSQWFLTHNL